MKQKFIVEIDWYDDIECYELWFQRAISKGLYDNSYVEGKDYSFVQVTTIEEE
jgi:hypothetical protein